MPPDKAMLSICVSAKLRVLLHVPLTPVWDTTNGLSANKIIGVKEIKEYLEKKLDLNQAIELINIKTRQYAKRQVTWSRGHMTDWKREYSNSFSELSKNILKLLS